ncbi:MAG: glycosyltransferase family 39 protein [Chloroflexi bacterium]|nr:glycosyltransferase family 39 protein [Chloroflexota bacterium]
MQTYAPDHAPGYFLMLNIWGRITSFDVAIARLLTIFAGLTTLAITYRLGNDFVGPAAGLIAVVIVASNAFFNHYYAHIPMYPMSTLASGIILWIYLRIMYQCRQVRSGDYLALFAAVFVLCNLHFFNSVFLAVLGVFHLIFAPKNRRWTLVSFAVIVAVLLFIPYPLAAADGLIATVAVKQADDIGMTRAIQAWQDAVTNREPLLLLIAIGGLALGAFRGKVTVRPWLALPVIFVVCLALLSHHTTFIADFTMRYHLANWLPCVLFFTTGFYGLYRFHKFLLLLVIL